MFKNLARLILLLIISSLFVLAFLTQHTSKGTLHADEPGVVLTSLSKNRSLYSVYKDVAYSSQPPLEMIIREKIYTPAGYALNRVAYRFPELFHRSESLVWWLLPIGFFFCLYGRFSTKNKYLIYLTFSLLVSSEFIGFYLAEAKHYSAIGAVFALMIITLLQDTIPVKQRFRNFMLASALIPFLHMASFFYYLFLNILVFIFLWVNGSKKERAGNIKIFIFWLLYMLFILVMYLNIKKISTDYQHPSINNIMAFSAVSEYLKWTLDWAFFKTPLYFLFDAIPQIIKSNLLFVLPTLSLPWLFKTAVELSKKQSVPKIMNWLIITVLALWPLNVVLFRYFAGMFSGERYSIGIMVTIFFIISFAVTENVWSKVKKKYLKHIILGTAIITCMFFAIKTVNFNFDLTTPEDVFISQNHAILGNPENVIIIDNGSHVHSVSLLARIDKFTINSELHYCTFGEFYINDKNTLNEWLKKNKSRNVYLFTAPRSFMNTNQIVWTNRNRVLYKLMEPIPPQELCANPWNQKECYLSCLKGYPVSTDGRSVPDMVPHIDVYRK